MRKLSTAILLACVVTGIPLMGADDAPASAPATGQSASTGLSLATVHGVYGASIRATGRVQAMVSARVGPRVSGRMAELGETDGQPLDVGVAVKKGQKLFALDLTTFQNHVALAEAQLASAQANLANLTAPTREEKLEQLQQDVTQMGTRLADKVREQARYKRLVEQEKTLPPRRLEEVDVDVASLGAQKKSAEARLMEAQRGPTPTEIAVAAARVKEAEAGLKIAENDLHDAVVYAPFDGVITQRFKSTGDYLVNMPPTDVMEIVSLDRLEAELAIPEGYLAAIQKGGVTLTIKSPLLSKALELPVARIGGQVDANKGTVVVRVLIPAEGRDLLIPGAFVTAELPLPESMGGVIVPTRAVLVEAGKSFVFVAQDGKMIRREIQPGDRLSEGMIASGLREGEQVILGPRQEMVDGRGLPTYLK